MKVLLINSKFGKGISGSGHHVYLLWKYLKDRIDFIIWHTGNIGYINIPKLKSVSFYVRAWLKKIPKDVDIIHIHNAKYAGLFREGRKNILTVHGDYRQEIVIQYGLLGKLIVKCIDCSIQKADIITTVSPLKAKMYGWLWIPNMIEVYEVKRIEPTYRLFDVFGVKPGRYILFVGRDDPVKDYPLFSKIARKVYRRLGIKAIALGVMRENTEYLVHARAPWKAVIGLMKAALALVITSKHEGFPTVLLEAWASGCPVVARGIPDLKVLSKMFKDSMLVFDTVDTAVSAIEQLLEDHSLRKHLIFKGYNVVKNFDAPYVVKQYYKLYRRLLNE